MSKAHVRGRKGFCGGRGDEAVKGNAVSADTQVSRASLCLLLLCAYPLLLNYTACTLLLPLSWAWRGCTVGMHGAKFWHCALETALCCFDLLLKACVWRLVSSAEERAYVCCLWPKNAKTWAWECTYFSMCRWVKVHPLPSRLVYTVVTLKIYLFGVESLLNQDVLLKFQNVRVRSYSSFMIL